jgi:hypothetical protein
VLGILLLVVPSALGQLGQFGTRIGPVLDNAQGWAAQLQPPFLAAAAGALIEAANASSRRALANRSRNSYWPSDSPSPRPP